MIREWFVRLGIIILLSTNLSCNRDVARDKNFVAFKKFRKENHDISNIGIQLYKQKPVINFQSIYKVEFVDSIGNLINTDTVKLSVFDNKWKADTTQYLIAWRIIKKIKDRFVNLENQNSYTGVLSNKNKIFLHPIRNGEYKKLGLAPFPLIEFNV